MAKQLTPAVMFVFFYGLLLSFMFNTTHADVTIQNRTNLDLNICFLQEFFCMECKQYITIPKLSKKTIRSGGINGLTLELLIPNQQTILVEIQNWQSLVFTSNDGFYVLQPMYSISIPHPEATNDQFHLSCCSRLKACFCCCCSKKEYDEIPDVVENQPTTTIALWPLIH